MVLTTVGHQSSSLISCFVPLTTMAAAALCCAYLEMTMRVTSLVTVAQERGSVDRGSRTLQMAAENGSVIATAM